MKNECHTCCCFITSSFSFQQLHCAILRVKVWNGNFCYLLFLLLSVVVNNEEFPEVAHLLSWVGVRCGHRQQLVEDAGCSLGIFQEERLVPKRVQDVVFR